MDSETSQKTALAVLCLLCMSPAILGVILGMWVQRRALLHGGWPAAFVPKFVIHWIEDRAK